MNFLSILDLFNDKQIEKLKQDFFKELLVKMQEEKRFCEIRKVKPQMNGKKVREIEVLVKKCWSAYHLEALRRFLFTEMVMPDWKTLEARANQLITEALHV